MGDFGLWMVIMVVLFIIASCEDSREKTASFDRCIRAHAAGISLKECEQIERKP